MKEGKNLTWLEVAQTGNLDIIAHLGNYVNDETGDEYPVYLNKLGEVLNWNFRTMDLPVRDLEDESDFYWADPSKRY